MTTKVNMALVLGLADKFGKGEWDDVAGAIDPNFVANVLGTTTLDWPGFKQFADGFLPAFGDGRHVFDYVPVDAENVVMIGSHRGAAAYCTDQQASPAVGEPLGSSGAWQDRGTPRPGEPSGFHAAAWHSSGADETRVLGNSGG